MELDPHQSVRIFGWWAQPRLTLAWEDIKQKNLSWRHLRDLGLKPEELMLVQPDKMQWIQRGGLQLHDILDMTVFPVNPLTDYRADLAELWNLQCTPEQLREMGVTYRQLVERGLNPQIMFYFNFSLSQWMKLGMAEHDIEALKDRECEAIFGMPKTEVAAIVADFAGAHKM
jgi:hypothetical protein